MRLYFVVKVFVIAYGVAITLARDCLKCYQCVSNMQEANPYCDDFYWHVLTDRKKEDFIAECPYKKSKFCGKYEENVTGIRTTKRGCLGSHDSKGHELKKGCIKYHYDEKEYHICFCSTSLCNSGRTFSEFKHSVYLVLIMVIRKNLLW